MTEFHTLSARLADGREQPMAAFRGKVLLVVNVASRCGFTPQYAGLEALQQQLAPRGFTVSAFPCNQFAGQEPGDERSIVEFCTTTYRTTFPIFGKIDVNGPAAHPIYRFLKQARPGLLGPRIAELHEVPARPRRRRHPPLPADDETGRHRKAIERLL